MLLIPCPWCGQRAQSEFTYRGDATVERPDIEDGDASWYNYVYTRDNPRGEHIEWWHHTSGCRRWFKLHRNTWTHEVLKSEPPGHEKSE